MNIGRKSKYEVLRCTLPDCSHFIQIELAVGKEALCPRCDKPFILDGEAIKLKTPHCIDCTKEYNYVKRGKPKSQEISVEDVAKRLDDILGNL